LVVHEIGVAEEDVSAFWREKRKTWLLSVAIAVVIMAADAWMMS
jgi:hypothetical protein